MHESEQIGSAEAASILGIARTTLTRRVVNGQIVPATKLPTLRGAYVFDRAYIEALAKESK